MTVTMSNALFGHVDEDTAYVVDDYPYGFRLRCRIRYWIETTKRGDRFCSQTTNPKVTGEVWNKPKRSTYVDVAVMYLDDEGHVAWHGLRSWPSLDVFTTVVDATLDHVDRLHAVRLAGLAGMNLAMARRSYPDLVDGWTAQLDRVKARLDLLREGD